MTLTKWQEVILSGWTKYFIGDPEQWQEAIFQGQLTNLMGKI